MGIACVCLVSFCFCRCSWIHLKRWFADLILTLLQTSKLIVSRRRSTDNCVLGISTRYVTKGIAQKCLFSFLFYGCSLIDFKTQVLITNSNPPLDFQTVFPSRSANNRALGIPTRYVTIAIAQKCLFSFRFVVAAKLISKHAWAMSLIQSKNKGRMQPKSVEKRCLFRAELLKEIAECANGVNHGLKTVDEVAAEDEVVACWTKNPLFSFIS